MKKKKSLNFFSWDKALYMIIRLSAGFTSVVDMRFISE